MKKQTAFLPAKVLLVSLGIVAVLMLLGSFVDYPLSHALYNKTNPVAMFFAAYGAIPAALGLTAAGCLLLSGRNRQHKLVGTAQCAGGAALILLGTLIACVMPIVYLPVPPAIPAAAGMVLSAGTVLLVWYLAHGTDRAVLLRAAAAIVLVILCEMVLVNCI